MATNPAASTRSCQMPLTPSIDCVTSDDPTNAGQRLDTWLAKLLRIDVSGGATYTVPADNPFVGVSGALPEIWNQGLRNTWRLSFDRLNGDLWIG